MINGHAVFMATFRIAPSPLPWFQKLFCFVALYQAMLMHWTCPVLIIILSFLTFLLFNMYDNAL